MNKKGKLNESELIRDIEEISLKTQKFNKPLVIKSIGDDCAIFKDKDSILVSTDSITENVHFTLNVNNFIEIGARALLVNLSDIAAMGGMPRLFTLSLFIPEYVNERDVKDILSGIVDEAVKYKVSLVGGNISGASELSISITVIGDYKNSNVLLRGSSKAGDLVFVSGELGNSWMSHCLLQNEELFKKNPVNLGSADKKLIDNFIKQFRLPTPRIKLGQELAVKKLANSLTDISDGLYKDILNVTGGSNGAEIWLDKLPVNEDMVYIAKLLKYEKYMSKAVSFGEDYELLWTAGEQNEEEILNLSKKFRLKINKIGKIVNNPAGVKFLNKGVEFPIEDFTFSHL